MTAITDSNSEETVRKVSVFVWIASSKQTENWRLLSSIVAFLFERVTQEVA